MRRATLAVYVTACTAFAWCLFPGSAADIPKGCPWKPVSAYGKRKTARILTATPFPVNTPNRPVMSRASLIYLACGRFKQTFVLDRRSGVDILHALKRYAVQLRMSVNRDP